MRLLSRLERVWRMRRLLVLLENHFKRTLVLFLRWTPRTYALKTWECRAHLLLCFVRSNPCVEWLLRYIREYCPRCNCFGQHSILVARAYPLLIRDLAVTRQERIGGARWAKSAMHLSHYANISLHFFQELRNFQFIGFFLAKLLFVSFFCGKSNKNSIYYSVRTFYSVALALLLHWSLPLPWQRMRPRSDRLNSELARHPKKRPILKCEKMFPAR